MPIVLRIFPKKKKSTRPCAVVKKCVTSKIKKSATKPGTKSRTKPLTKTLTKQRRQAYRAETYTRWKYDTSEYHTYTSRRTKNLDRYDKAAITRVHNKLVNHINAAREGRAIFVKTSKSNIRTLKKGNQYITTNRGFFMYGLNIKKVILKGKGKNLKISIYKKQQRETYYSVKPNFENIIDLINWIWGNVKPKPNSIRVAFNQYTATRSHTHSKWLRYQEKLLTLEEEILEEGYDTPYNGVLAIWYF